jgi:ABC-type branched-subunit amino acid transport system ATPase component
MVLHPCSRIFGLDFGHPIAEGTPDEIRNDPVVKAAYLGDEPVHVAGEA